MFLSSHSLDTVSSSDMLFCFELLSKEMAKEKVVLLRVQQVRTPLTLTSLHRLFYVCGPGETSFSGLFFPRQKLQVPDIPISKCAACLKPPTSEEDKLKRCTRCYRVGYCNQSVSPGNLHRSGRSVHSRFERVRVHARSVQAFSLLGSIPQGLPEEPLAQPQESVSAQRGERGPAVPAQRARVPPLLRPPHPAAGGLLQVPAAPC